MSYFLLRNGWGSYPIATTLAVPLEGLTHGLQQAWLDFIEERVFSGATASDYYDLGQVVQRFSRATNCTSRSRVPRVREAKFKSVRGNPPLSCSLKRRILQD